MLRIDRKIDDGLSVTSMSITDIVFGDQDEEEHTEDPFMDDGFEDKGFSLDFFGSFSKDEFKKSIEPTFLEAKKDITICDCCGTKMDLSDEKTYYLCSECGIERKIIGDQFKISNTNRENYNTSSVASSTIRMTGPKSYSYQKQLISVSSSYIKTQKKTTVSEICKYVFEYKGSKPPKNIVMAAAELYHSNVQKHRIQRGNVRTGTMAACLYRKCIEMGIVRKPKEIADIFNIEQEDLSNGIKILNQLEAKGVIHKPIMKKDIIESFVDRYFEGLGIPNVQKTTKEGVRAAEYRTFVLQLIKFTKKKRIANNSVGSSKCAGSIFVLCKQRPELKINANQIVKECNVAKATFTRFAKAIYDTLKIGRGHKKYIRKKQLAHLFKKYNIPL